MSKATDYQMACVRKEEMYPPDFIDGTGVRFSVNNQASIEVSRAGTFLCKIADVGTLIAWLHDTFE